MVQSSVNPVVSGGAVRAEVARLQALGASDERAAIDTGEEYWVRMNDPEGNEFCVQ